MLSEEVKKQYNKGIKLVKERNFAEAFSIFQEILKEKMVSTLEKGEIYYHITSIFKDIESDHSLINELMENEKGLIMSNKYKPLTPEHARKFLGRKYLKMSAECNYVPGLAEYALVCINCDPGGGLNYDPTEENAKVALAWADQMKKNKDPYIKTIAYVVYTKYYFVKCATSSEIEDINNYGDNLLIAQNLDSENEYVKYFLGHLYANPKFKDYQDGKYTNVKKGYEYFKEVEEIANDVLLVKSSRKIIETLETKYPDKIV